MNAVGRCISALIATVPLLLGGVTVNEAQAGLARCQALPRSSYQTGLLFNPEGMQTYYQRSRCFQDLAAVLRDAKLCDPVVERPSWFFDGSGYSRQACRGAVVQRVHADMAAAKVLRPPQQLEWVRVLRNGNGRDFDIRLRTSGSDGAGLRLMLSVVDRHGRRHVLSAEAQPMDDRASEIWLFVPADHFARALGDDWERVPVSLRASMTRTLTGTDERSVHAHAPRLKLQSRAETVFLPAGLKYVPR